MSTKTTLPPRMRLKQVMTVTAFGLVQIRTAWRTYLADLSAERQHLRRQRRG